MSKKKTFLVTGSAGFIPSHLIDKLLEKGYRVIGLDDLSIGSQKTMATFINNKQFHFVKGDVRDYQLLKKLVAESDYIYHGAVRGVSISTDNPIDDLRVNTESTVLLLELAKKKKVDLFIFPSSASVYGDPKHIPEKEEDNPVPSSPYGVSKLASERYCLVYHQIYGLPIVCLRYFNTYGPRQRKDSLYGGAISIFFDQAMKGHDLTVYGDGRQTRDFIHVDDTVRATIACLDKPKAIGEIINVSAGKEISINDLAKIIIKISDKKVRIKHTKERLIDNVSRRVADISKAKKLLSFSPRIGIEEGLRRTYQWLEKNP